jgi:ABC-type transport system involved in multi-copper enzyme maturation permease subunit
VKAELNPLIVRELRGGLRSGRRIALLTFFLTVVGLFFLGVFQIAASALESESGAPAGSAIGGTFFPIVVAAELFFVCAITPAQTAGALAVERERQTYDLLLVTPLAPGEIVLGKLASGLAYVLLLLLAALPMQSLAFLMGGVGPEQLALAFLLLGLSALLFGCLGLWASAIFRGSRAASAFAYALTGLLTLGLPAAALFLSPLGALFVQSHQSLLTEPPPWLIYTAELLAATNPWVVAGMTEAQLQAGTSLVWFHQVFGKTHADLPGPWLLFVLLYALGAALLLWWTARLVRRRRAGE